MTAFERFDLNGRAATSQEIARRWRDFHRQVRRASSSRVTRLVGPLLGDDTRRRRFAQRLRPDQPDVVVVREEVATFPLDYVATLRHNPSSSAAWGHVEIVEATPGDNDGLVAGLRRALDSAKDWVLIVDARSTDDERH